MSLRHQPPGVDKEALASFCGSCYVVLKTIKSTNSSAHNYEYVQEYLHSCLKPPPPPPPPLHTHTHTHTHTPPHTHTHTQKCPHKDTGTHTYIFTHVHTHTHESEGVNEWDRVTLTTCVRYADFTS